MSWRWCLLSHFWRGIIWGSSHDKIVDTKWNVYACHIYINHNHLHALLSSPKGPSCHCTITGPKGWDRVCIVKSQGISQGTSYTKPLEGPNRVQPIWHCKTPEGRTWLMTRPIRHTKLPEGLNRLQLIWHCTSPEGQTWPTLYGTRNHIKIWIDFDRYGTLHFRLKIEKHRLIAICHPAKS